jgi:hypothetical protein
MNDRHKVEWLRADRINTKKLRSMKESYEDSNYSCPKYLLFIEAMLNNNFAVKLRKSKSTRSKYVYVKKNGKILKIRFSNHRPNFFRQKDEDCDYYVGVSHSKIISTESVISEVILDLTEHIPL